MGRKSLKKETPFVRDIINKSSFFVVDKNGISHHVIPVSALPHIEEKIRSDESNKLRKM